MMKTTLFKLFVMIVIFSGFWVVSGCKSADEAADLGQYTLTVTLGEGVSGIPAAGTHTHTENDVVTYSYSSQSGYGNLAATLDGDSIPAEGTITMTGNHTLNVISDIDVRGTWTGIFDTGYSHFFTVTFSGGVTAGNAEGQTDAIVGKGTGNFEITDDQIHFNLDFPSSLAVSFFGIIENVNRISGTWDFGMKKELSAPYPKGLFPSTGYWELER